MKRSTVFSRFEQLRLHFVQLLSALGLPPRLSKKELVEALNRLYSYEQLDEMQAELLKA